ncbi:MAG: 1-phosphofructokinase [Bacteroidales bacterium]
MIYTLTLNPALDRNLWIDSIKKDDSNRIIKEERYAAGKGIDVSRVLTTLGVCNTALGFVGGFDGDEMEGRLINEGISCNLTRISGETRINLVLYDQKEESQTIFSARGPEIQPFELIRLIRLIQDLQDVETMIISGSLPPGVHAEVYAKIMEIVRDKRGKVILDTDGEALQRGIRVGPEVIKPNIHELGRLLGREVTVGEDLLAAARETLNMGCQTLLVSMGPRGILLVTRNEEMLAVPPKVEVVNTIGAGDSAVAGFVCGRARGLSDRDALIRAVAAGTATTLRPGPALCTRDDFEALIPRVEVRQGKHMFAGD